LISCHVRIDSLGLESVVCFGSKRSGNISSKSVDSLVPDSVQFVSFVMVRNREVVCTSITIGVGIIEASSGMERLGNITHIMDEKSKSVGSCYGGVSGVKCVLNIFVHIRAFIGITVFAGEPVCDVGKSCSDVVCNWGVRARVIGCSFACLINERYVDKVEVCLPAPAMVLNIIGKGRALDIRIISFSVYIFGVVRLKSR